MEYAIGIDIGGTNTKIGAVLKDGKVVAENRFSTTDARDYNSYMSLLVKAIKSLMELVSEGKCMGIGLGAPNANYYTGAIEMAPNLPFTSGPIVDTLRMNFNLEHMYLTNDANAAALGEKIYGGAKDMKDFIMITLGTGLGSGIVVNGKMVYGADGFAGELGHVTVVDSGRMCNCGKRGCLEAYVSATGIKRTYFEKVCEYNGRSTISDVKWSDMDAKVIEDAARAGDKAAIETYEYTGYMLGKSLADFVMFSRPEAIFLFGGPVKAGDLIFKPAEKSMNEHLLEVFKNKVKLLPSKLPSAYAAILGASALVWDAVENA